MRRVLAGLALGVCLLGWARLLWVARRPSPARHLRFFTLDGPVAEDRFYTHRPLAADGDRLWVDGSDRDDRNLLFRVDFAKRRADALWELPKSAWPALTLATHASGDLVLCAGHGNTEIYRLRAAGGVERVGTFDAIPKGIAWVGEDVEVVLDDHRGARIHRYHAGGWTASDLAPPPDPRKFLHVRVEHAWFANGGWHFIYTRSIADPADAQVATLELLERSGTGPATVVSHARLELLEGHHELSIDVAGVALMRLQYVYNSKYGLFWSGRNFAMEQSDLTLRPSLSRSVALAWAREPRAYVLARAEHQGPVLTRDRFIDYSSIVAPSADGGFWILGGFGRHVKTNAELARADAMRFFERFANLFREFPAYARGWEKASVPFTLLFLPLALAVALAWPRRGTQILLALCIAIALLGATGFLDITAVF